MYVCVYTYLVPHVFFVGCSQSSSISTIDFGWIAHRRGRTVRDNHPINRETHTALEANNTQYTHPCVCVCVWPRVHTLLSHTHRIHTICACFGERRARDSYPALFTAVCLPGCLHRVPASCKEPSLCGTIIIQWPDVVAMCLPHTFRDRPRDCRYRMAVGCQHYVGMRLRRLSI